MISRGKYKLKRICCVLGISRANQYVNPKGRPHVYKKIDDQKVLKSILEHTKERATYGYQRVTALINRQRKKDGIARWNKKRILRVMRINNLILARSPLKQKRPHIGQVITMKSNVRWCTDIFEIRCWNGEKVFVAFSLDCHDREAMSFVAQKRAIFHHDIIELMDKTVTHRFGDFVEKIPHPIQWLSDNGPQFIANQLRTYGADWGLDMINTPSYSPESNGMAEAFVKLFKRDYVYTNEIWTAESVMRNLPIWFEDYNKHHPHSGLNMRSPLEYLEETFKNSEVYV